MKIEIIAVGTELLSTRFRDTNSLYLTDRLAELGLAVSRRTIVGDQGAGLEDSLRRALSFSDLVLVSGGLGPTGDDLTREAAAAALGRGLVYRPDLLAAMESRFLLRGRAMPEPNRRQAWIVEGAEVLANAAGTAPGQWIEADRRYLVLLPGPPPELRSVFEGGVVSRLSPWARPGLARTVIRSTGLAESEVEARIEGLYPESEESVLTVLASPGRVDIHLAADSSPLLEEWAGRIRERLGPAVYGGDGVELEDVVIDRLIRIGSTLATAESCTGGLLAHRLTNVPGSSRAFLGGYVAYGNGAKIRDLGLDAGLISSRGAVSEEAARAMAAGARARMGSDWALALTGIAGPDGGTPDKPVGLVHIALAGPGGTEAERRVFLGRRDAVKTQSSQRALDMLRLRLRDL